MGGLTEADFLKLLTTQLQNQDPSKPTDPNTLASEFSDLSVVGGINTLNSEVTAIQASGQAGQLGQATALIGKQVTTAGNGLVTNSSGAATGAFDLPSAADATVTILNANGTVAGTVPLHSLNAGVNSFTWSGGKADSAYTFEVSATGSSGPVTATPYNVGTVSSVDLSGSTPAVSLTGAATPVPLSQITSILGS